MQRIINYLDISHEKLTRKAWDNCIAIVGDEGKSKSNLGLHCVDYWYNKRNGECKAEDARHVCLTREEWAKDLRDAQKYEMTVYDEAGDINSRRSMSSFNTSVMEAYQVIRADNIFSILILPSLWDLDKFFRTRRLRGVFYVYKRGHVAFWSQSRMKKMLEVNASRTIKNYFAVPPLFYDRFPIYKGVLLEPYLQKKTEKMKGIREGLYNKIVGDAAKPKNERDGVIAKFAEALGTKETAGITGLSIRQVQRIRQCQTSQEV